MSSTDAAQCSVAAGHSRSSSRSRPDPKGIAFLPGCLSSENTDRISKWRRRHADNMVRFEEALATRRDPHLNLSELCTASGVPERTLRLCCAEVLGVSPIRYFLLRRLNMTRSALRRADPETASVAEIARDHQFTELGRFAVVYRAIFGETHRQLCGALKSKRNN